MRLGIHFLSVFREIFVPHHRSLEFRSKVFAAMLIAKKEITEDDISELEGIVKEFYKNDQKRVNILIATTEEYIKRVHIYKNLTLDSLLKDIDKTLKIHKRYAKKIDFAHLRRLISEDDEDDALLQQRVYEFFVSEVKMYS